MGETVLARRTVSDNAGNRVCALSGATGPGNFEVIHHRRLGITMKRTALTIWFAAAAVLVAADAYVCYAHVRRLIDNARLVAHSRDIVSAADRLLSSLKDAETGQ